MPSGVSPFDSFAQIVTHDAAYLGAAQIDASPRVSAQPIARPAFYTKRLLFWQSIKSVFDDIIQRISEQFYDAAAGSEASFECLVKILIILNGVFR